MADSIMDIESGIEKIEVLVKNLREDRDKARSEVAALKSALDDRELELLQIDEELQQERRRFEEQLSESVRSKEDLEHRLTEVASKIRNLLPLIAGYPEENAIPATEPALPDSEI
jgi:chromosome segregation ATPase